MLRRRTDPKTRTHTLCEPARSKCTWTFDKSHFVQEFTGKMPQTSWIPRPRPRAIEIHFGTLFLQKKYWFQDGDPHIARACAKSKCISQEPFYQGIYRKNAGVQDCDPHLVRACPVEMHLDISNSHFTWEFAGKMPGPRPLPTLCARCAVDMHLDVSQELLYATISRNNARAQMEHPDQAPAFTLTRTPQCGHCLGKISRSLRGAFQESQVGNTCVSIWNNTFR